MANEELNSDPSEDSGEDPGEDLIEESSENPPTARNSDLGAAQSAKNDEFYTQWVDIEREINAYLEYNPDVFRNKTVLLPCDDPEWSNFTKFFALHFVDFGLEKLISTSYAPNSNANGEFYEPTLFELDSPDYDEMKSMERGRVFVLEGKDVSEDGIINIDDLQWSYLKGDGDFRSEEVTSLRDEADVIITNGPFSLFRELLAWIIDGDKQFSILGNVNALTYKEVFPLILEDMVWLGPSISSGDREFRVPDSYPLEAAGQREEDGNKYIRVKGVRWFTNLEHGRRHEPLRLMTMADNEKYSKRSEVRGAGYPRYDNYDAIEVPFVEAIPGDYDGVMGVPITFLDKHNPDQFEILGITDRGNEYGLKTREYTKDDVPRPGDLNRRAAIKLGDGTHKATYARLLIRRKTPNGD